MFAVDISAVRPPCQGMAPEVCATDRERAAIQSSCRRRRPAGAPGRRDMGRLRRWLIVQGTTPDGRNPSGSGLAPSVPEAGPGSGQRRAARWRHRAASDGLPSSMRARTAPPARCRSSAITWVPAASAPARSCDPDCGWRRRRTPHPGRNRCSAGPARRRGAAPEPGSDAVGNASLPRVQAAQGSWAAAGCTPAADRG